MVRPDWLQALLLQPCPLTLVLSLAPWLCLLLECAMALGGAMMLGGAMALGGAVAPEDSMGSGGAMALGGVVLKDCLALT